MKWQILILVAVLVLVVVFAAINWQAFAALTTLNLVVRRVEAPLGVALLAVIAFLTALYLVFLASVRTTHLVETRRYAKEASDARQLADQAEASRFAQLKEYLEQELEGLQASVREEGVATREELTEAARNLGTAFDESHNSLVANLGEMETRHVGETGTQDTPDTDELGPSA